MKLNGYVSTRTETAPAPGEQGVENTTVNITLIPKDSENASNFVEGNIGAIALTLNNLSPAQFKQFKRRSRVTITIEPEAFTEDAK